MANFYNIYIIPKEGKFRSDIEEIMDDFLDWVRYGKNNYIVYSTINIRQIKADFKPLVEPDGRLFICKFDTSDYNGWMPKGFWEWIKKDRNNNK